MYIFQVNGTWQNSGDPTSGSSKTGGGTGAAFSYRNTFQDGEPIYYIATSDGDTSGWFSWTLMLS